MCISHSESGKKNQTDTASKDVIGAEFVNSLLRKIKKQKKNAKNYSRGQFLSAKTMSRLEIQCKEQISIKFLYLIEFNGDAFKCILFF